MSVWGFSIDQSAKLYQTINDKIENDDETGEQFKNPVDHLFAVKHFCCKCKIFLPYFLLLCSFAAAHEKEKAQLLMNMLNTLPHPKVLFLSGFGKLNVGFPSLLFLKRF